MCDVYPGQTIIWFTNADPNDRYQTNPYTWQIDYYPTGPPSPFYHIDVDGSGGWHVRGGLTTGAWPYLVVAYFALSVPITAPPGYYKVYCFYKALFGAYNQPYIGANDFSVCGFQYLVDLNPPPPQCDCDVCPVPNTSIQM